MTLKATLRAQWDRVGATALCSLGVLLLVVGWFGVSNTTYAAEQIPWVISCGIGGVFCLGMAATLWLSADLQDEWRKLDSLEGSLLGMEEALERSTAVALEVGAEPEPEPAPLRVASAAVEETGPIPVTVPAAPVRRPRARTVKAG